MRGRDACGPHIRRTWRVRGPDPAQYLRCAGSSPTSRRRSCTETTAASGPASRSGASQRLVTPCILRSLSATSRQRTSDQWAPPEREPASHPWPAHNGGSSLLCRTHFHRPALLLPVHRDAQAGQLRHHRGFTYLRGDATANVENVTHKFPMPQAVPSSAAPRTCPPGPPHSSRPGTERTGSRALTPVVGGGPSLSSIRAASRTTLRTSNAGRSGCTPRDAPRPHRISNRVERMPEASSKSA